MRSLKAIYTLLFVGMLLEVLGPLASEGAFGCNTAINNSKERASSHIKARQNLPWRS